jgi:uncharacterized repeat protein (TIGR01451 family)
MPSKIDRMNSRLLSISILLLCLFTQKKTSAQPGNYVINVPDYATVVEGTLNLSGSFGDYYIGYGDSVISNGGMANFFVDNGGYLQLVGGFSMIYAANFSTIDVTGGGIDSFFRDWYCNVIGNPGVNLLISPMHFSFTLGSSDVDNFHVHAQKHCSGPEINIYSSNGSVGMGLITDYGDGSVDTSFLQQTYSTSYAKLNHIYSVTDTYNVKQVLYNNTERIDSMSFSYIHVSCSEMSVRFYNDLDNNCTYDISQDLYVITPLSVEIDSNNIAIDTVTANGGILYRAYGNNAAIYTFKVVGSSGDIVPSCPITGSVSNTFQQGDIPPNYIGFSCPNQNAQDVMMNIMSNAGFHLLSSNVYLTNEYCLPTNTTLTMNYDPVFPAFYSSPPPNSQGNGIATWNFTGVSNQYPVPISIHLDGAQLATGTPLTTTYSITPTTNDVDPSNNSIVIIDTVVGGWDPNAIYVKPEGCTPAGSTLEYTITFENLGNGVAENIYILDTLPIQLDAKSLKLKFASHSMFIETIPFGQATVVKFSFPDIMLPDSSNHIARHGGVKFEIDVKAGLPSNTNFKNRAGIYFDYNPPVLTNEAYNKICLPTAIKEATSIKSIITVYPNPATEEFTIKTEQSYTSYTITNSIGQVMMTKDMNGKESKVNVKELSTGIYYISLKGQGGTEVRKFVKL